MGPHGRSEGGSKLLLDTDTCLLESSALSICVQLDSEYNVHRCNIQRALWRCLPLPSRYTKRAVFKKALLGSYKLNY